MNANESQDPAGQGMETVSFEQMHLQVGETLRLAPQDPGAAPAHYTVQYIGALPDKGLITTLPMAEGKGLWMPPGGSFVIRVLSGTHVFAFTSQVIRARANPYPHVHFQYPPSVQARKVRKSLRVSMNLPVRITGAGGTALPAILLDLGMHGARIETQASLAGEAQLQLTLPIRLEEAQSQLQLQALIRNRVEREAPDGGPSRQLGLEFQPLPEQEALLLHYFIDHALAEGGAEMR